MVTNSKYAMIEFYITKINKIINKFTSVWSITLVITYLLISPLTANAKTVEVWELDNFFSKPSCFTCNDTSFIERINIGDRIRFVNMGVNVHAAANDIVAIGDKVFLEGELFTVEIHSPGQSIITPPFEDEGIIPFFCQVHGRIMSGTIIVETKKKFQLECDHTLTNGFFGLEILIMEPDEIANCTLTITDRTPNTFIETTTNLIGGIIRPSITIDPVDGITNENGELGFTITAIEEGLGWIAWAIPNNDGKIEFNKNAYDNGYAWGMFVVVGK